MAHGSVAVPYRWDQCTIPHGTGAGPTEEASLLLANPPQTARVGQWMRGAIQVTCPVTRAANSTASMKKPIANPKTETTRVVVLIFASFA
jgi:hypothetical protein